MIVMIKFASEHFDALQIAAVRNAVGALIIFLTSAPIEFSCDNPGVLDAPMAVGTNARTISLGGTIGVFLCRHQNRNRDRTNHRLCDAFVCHGTQRSAVKRSGRPMALGAVGIGFVGVMLVLQPFAQGFQWVMVLPLFAAFCYGTNLVTVRLFDRDVKTLLINNYSSWSAVVFSLVLFWRSAIQTGVRQKRRGGRLLVSACAAVWAFISSALGIEKLSQVKSHLLITLG